MERTFRNKSAKERNQKYVRGWGGSRGGAHFASILAFPSFLTIRCMVSHRAQQ
jgi:hypothetical protein